MNNHLTDFIYRNLLLLAVLLCLFGESSFAQTNAADNALQSALDSVVTIYTVSPDKKQETAVGSGLVVGAKGYLITPYHLVRDAAEVRVKLRNGEIFDNAQIIAKDERRNVAVLHILATGLKVIPNGSVDESNFGGLAIVTNPSGAVSVNKDGWLIGIQLADSVPGAGSGYRVLLFDAKTNENQVGGLLLNEYGSSIGIVTTNPNVKSQNIAVPFSSIAGLIQSIAPENTAAPVAARTVATSPTPVPIPQTSVEVPQRAVRPLDPKGPGSIVVTKQSAVEVLKTAKTVYVDSDTIYFKPEQLIPKLSKYNEVQEWGWVFVNDREVADLILEIDHVLFTYKFTFNLYSQRQGVIVSNGGVIIFDGNLGAGTMAKHIVKKVKAVRGADEKPKPKQETKPAAKAK